MGRSKLLLPLAGQPLIQHTLAAWKQAKVDQLLVVVRPGDTELASVACAIGTTLIIPGVAPPDMKSSVIAALNHIELAHAPTEDDAFLVAPADMPGLSSAVIVRLMQQHQAGTTRSILAPTIVGRRGHPVLFPWPLAEEVFSLAESQGLDAIVHRHQPRLIPCDDLATDAEQLFADIDTPEDYERLTIGQRLNGQ